MSRGVLGQSAAALASIVVLGVVSGCGGGSEPSTNSQTADEPAYLRAPFSHQQRLVEAGARLYVSDGCSACHAIGSRRGGLGPSFAVLAGNRVTLADGHSALVDEGFLRRALTDPRGTRVRGYPSAPMVVAVKRLGLTHDRAAVAELAAFIEQIGPETPSG